MIFIKVIKKNQVVMFIMALVLVSVGYLTYKPGETTNFVSTTLDNSTLADIGDATLVSTKGIVNEIENSLETSAVTTKVKDEYFTNSRIERDKMYSQMLESYQKMVENTNTTAEQRAIVTKEIQQIHNTKNSIMISENLIKNKGIEDVIIFVNLESISVIVKSKELSKEQIAQIQNIVTRELKAEVTNVHISTK